MKRKTQQRDIPSLLERYELKYLIPDWMVEPVSDFVSLYCFPDRYSEHSDDGYYQVNSLYFDSPAFTFLKRRMLGSESRFNMRIRSYGSQAGIPCFFEVKQKTGGVIKKYRAAVFDEAWPSIFADPGVSWARDDAGGDSGPDLFCRLALTYGASPKVLTQYRRKAFVSEVDDYARVTFDRDLRFQQEETYTVVPDDSRMINYDDATVFDPETCVIMELKCYCTQVPLWMLDLIRYFNLKQGRFSKYAASINAVFQSMAYAPVIRMPVQGLA